MTEATKEAVQHATEQANASLEQAIQLLEEAMGTVEQQRMRHLHCNKRGIRRHGQVDGEA